MKKLALLTSDGNTSTDVETSVTEESCDNFSSSSSSEGTRQRKKHRKAKTRKPKARNIRRTRGRARMNMTR